MAPISELFWSWLRFQSICGNWGAGMAGSVPSGGPADFQEAAHAGLPTSWFPSYICMTLCFLLGPPSGEEERGSLL